MKKSIEMRQGVAAKLAEWQKALESRDAENDAQKREALSLKVTEAHTAYNTSKRELDETLSLEAAQESDAGNFIDEKRRKQAQEGEESKVAKRYSLVRAMNAVSQGKNLDGLEGEMMQEADKEARESQISLSGTIRIPGFMARAQRLETERRDMSAGTTTAGGYTVPTLVQDLIPILEPKLVTRALGATILTGLSGNLSFPRNNVDAACAWEGEVTDADQTDPTFDQVTMSPKRLAAFAVFSKQLMVQSSIDIENFVRRRINFAVAKGVDQAAINGSGASNQPTGILNTAGIGSVVMGTNGGNPTWAKIVDLETAIATGDADMGRLCYLSTPGIRGKLKQTEKASSTGMFIWTDDRVGDSRMGQLNGLNAFTSTLVPSTLTKGTSSGVCHAVIFGNWEELVIGQWAGLDIVLDNITLAGKAQVKVIVNSWWDIMVKHAASFAAIKDATIS